MITVTPGDEWHHYPKMSVSELCAELENRYKIKKLPGRGLHSSTFQPNLSALYGIGGVRKGLCSPC